MTLDPLALFRSLSDETRLRLLCLLAAEGELCVCELTHSLRVSQPKISRHLATLREAGVVADRRLGQWIYYRLHPDLPDWARRVVREARVARTQGGPHVADRRTLRCMPNRPARMRRAAAGA